MKKGMEDEERERNNERVKKRETGGGKMGNKKEQSTQLRFILIFTKCKNSLFLFGIFTFLSVQRGT